MTIGKIVLDLISIADRSRSKPMIDPLTLDQMRVLVAVADAGSFSAAARKLGRVQSAVSQAIQTLETTLRLNLFDRSGKTPRLTDAGKALVGDARALIVAAQAIRARSATRWKQFAICWARSRSSGSAWGTSFSASPAAARFSN